MPIFYNFYILLATFYIIFGTNILIKCPVPVPVYCMFFVSQKTISNGVQTEQKWTEIFFVIFMNFGKKNQRETMPEGATRMGRAQGPRGHSVRQ